MPIRILHFECVPPGVDLLFGFSAFDFILQVKLTYWKAVFYCANLNEGGLSDWRLPTNEEIHEYIQINGIPANGINTWTTNAFQQGTYIFNIVIEVDALGNGSSKSQNAGALNAWEVNKVRCVN